MLKTKVDIISGFLGAGKTTFIKKLLEDALKGEQTVLIENEFGEIGIDGSFLKNAGIEIREMNSGCICCSLVGDFSSNLKEILEKYHPDRIIIEPSGVGKLSDVIAAVSRVESSVELLNNSAVTIVDAKKIRLYAKNFGEFFNNQIENAKLIVLSRTDIMDKEKIAEAVSLVRAINPKARIIDTPLTKLSGTRLLELMENEGSFEAELLEETKNSLKQHMHEEECGCGHTHHHAEEGECGCGHTHHRHAHGEECGCGHAHHHAEEIFESWGAEQVPAIREKDFAEFLEELSEGSDYGVVLRAKGMIPEEGGEKWLYFDVVPGEVLLREGEPEYTGKVCVIGSNLKKDELKKAFGV